MGWKAVGVGGVPSTREATENPKEGWWDGLKGPRSQEKDRSLREEDHLYSFYSQWFLSCFAFSFCCASTLWSQVLPQWLYNPGVYIATVMTDPRLSCVNHNTQRILWNNKWNSPQSPSREYTVEKQEVCLAPSTVHAFSEPPSDSSWTQTVHIHVLSFHVSALRPHGKFPKLSVLLFLLMQATGSLKPSSSWVNTCCMWLLWKVVETAYTLSSTAPETSVVVTTFLVLYFLTLWPHTVPNANSTPAHLFLTSLDISWLQMLSSA